MTEWKPMFLLTEEDSPVICLLTDYSGVSALYWGILESDDTKEGWVTFDDEFEGDVTTAYAGWLSLPKNTPTFQDRKKRETRKSYEDL